MHVLKALNLFIEKYQDVTDYNFITLSSVNNLYHTNAATCPDVESTKGVSFKPYVLNDVPKLTLKSTCVRCLDIIILSPSKESNKKALNLEYLLQSIIRNEKVKEAVNEVLSSAVPYETLRAKAHILTSVQGVRFTLINDSFLTGFVNVNSVLVRELQETVKTVENLRETLCENDVFMKSFFAACANKILSRVDYNFAVFPATNSRIKEALRAQSDIFVESLVLDSKWVISTRALSAGSLSTVASFLYDYPTLAHGLYMIPSLLFEALQEPNKDDVEYMRDMSIILDEKLTVEEFAMFKILVSDKLLATNTNSLTADGLQEILEVTLTV